MNRRTLLSLFAASLALASTDRVAQADNLVIKLATRAPKGSPWDKLLRQAAELVQEKTGGAVTFKIFASGTMGDEGDMVKKMRIGQLQAAAISSFGLHDITPEPQALDLPMIVDNDAERDALLTQMAPSLNKALAAKGFIVLSWSDIGSTYFFSTAPRPNLDEARKGKLFCWNGDPASKDAWVNSGFKPVVLSSNDIVPSLTTGMIDTLVYTPTLVLGYQAQSRLRFMMNLRYSSLTGATILDKKIWDKLTPDHQNVLLKVFQDLGEQSTKQARAMDAAAIETLKSQGVTMVQVTDAPAWRKAVETARQDVRGKVVPAETFDQVMNTIKSLRSKGK